MNTSAEIVTLPWQRYSDPERKLKFARLLQESPDTHDARYKAALRVFPDPGDETLAAKAMNEWLNDPIVINEIARLNKEQKPEELPSREQQARDIYNLAQDASKPVDDRIKAHKLYAEIMGFVQKPAAGGGGGNTYVDNRRVIIMPAEPASIEEWEADAMAHQAKLVSDASQ